MIKNWFNQDCHPTDAYIHWGDDNPKEKSELLREAYDLIADLGPEYKAKLTFLLSESYSSGRNDRSDEEYNDN